MDLTGQALTYVYARETRSDADTAKVLTMNEARRIARNIAKLPTLLSATKESELIFQKEAASGVGFGRPPFFLCAASPHHRSPGRRDRARLLNGKNISWRYCRGSGRPTIYPTILPMLEANLTKPYA